MKHGNTLTVFDTSPVKLEKASTFLETLNKTQDSKFKDEKPKDEPRERKLQKQGTEVVIEDTEDPTSPLKHLKNWNSSQNVMKGSFVNKDDKQVIEKSENSSDFSASEAGDIEKK